MNRLILITTLLLSHLLMAQVGIGTATPDPAAVLDINSEIESGVYGGLKLPTINEADKSGIPTPIPDGLMLYVIDGSNRCVELYNATSSTWVEFYCMNKVPVASGVAIDNTAPFITETINFDGSGFSQTDAESDAAGTSLYQWYRADDIAGLNEVPISGANSVSYTVTAADDSKFIRLGVTPTATTGASPGAEVYSSYTSQVDYFSTSVDFVNTTSSVTEGGLFIDVSVSITNPSSTVDTTVEIALDASSTATNGVDYDDGATIPAAIMFPAVITFPAGSNGNQEFTIYISTDDLVVESNESVILNLENVAGGNSSVIGINSGHTLTILDDDALPTPWINELHYDNTGGDVNEGFEIAGLAGLDLTGFTVRLWNGSNGASYYDENLSGTIPDQLNGYGTLWFATSSSIQNGSPDGIALYDSSNNLIQFLSYEGSFTNSDGDNSINIGVSEGGSTPVGFSLQLSGLGTTYSDFIWQSPAADTRGSINTGQTF
ncbi:hypothetical protein [uncultured Nonlabens sp.]|uniref:hypothetical protein n=1 Tax=uncultured Nonlabens sp. TaxID=859306 RepID=UPI00261680AA|nr:hypothetical protein [uncultured Nonlabens sp.]